MNRLQLTSDEQDAFTGWRKVLIWRAGDIKKIKRRYHRRIRRKEKQIIMEAME